MSHTGQHNLGITNETMEQVFPFHIAFNEQMTILQTGVAMKKLCSNAVSGKQLDTLVNIKTPAGLDFSFDAIASQAFSVFFLQLKSPCMTTVVLKGQMLCDHASRTIIFLGSPVANDVNQLAAIGLELNDFAIHDSSVDFLILLQTKDHTIKDVRKLAERLKNEVKIRREAEAELRVNNEELEQRVANRTQELSRTNTELHHSIGKLEIQNRQISMINAMGDMLQACRTVKETYYVIMDSMQQLFYSDSGLMAMRNAPDDYEVVISWGGVPEASLHSFAVHRCWCLKKKSNHVVEDDNQHKACVHVEKVPNDGYICEPILDHGVQIGVIHLLCNTRQLKHTASEDFQTVDDRKHLIHTVAEHASLAISNIKLQLSLREQSIKDPLTGLYNRRHMEHSLHRELDLSLRNNEQGSIVMIDVDHFKNFNDTYGHLAGDAVLKGLGSYLKKHIRSSDVACRYGGEEFILILPNTNAEQSQIRGEVLRAGVENELRINFQKSNLPPVTISVGIACFPSNDATITPEKLIKLADNALYEAKSQGRNRVVITHAN